jgi:hypothetical protein
VDRVTACPLGTAFTLDPTIVCQEVTAFEGEICIAGIRPIYKEKNTSQGSIDE